MRTWGQNETPHFLTQLSIENITLLIYGIEGMVELGHIRVERLYTGMSGLSRESGGGISVE